MTGKLKLVKVLVQPIFVVDHGDYCDAVDHPAIEVHAKDWPTYPTTGFAELVSSAEKELAQPRTND